MDKVQSIAMLFGIASGTIIVIGFLLSRLYKRAPKDAALIRTGLGGQKVIVNGGILVLPVFHDLMHVSLKTIKMDVDRTGGKDALLTKDSIRVDVTGLFHIRVAHDEAAIAKAAETLGESVNNPKAVADMLSGKLISALRSAAAKMTMDELHMDRAGFISHVSALAKGDLDPNGLELETVALTHFDQTPLRELDPNNAFDAIGMAVISKITEDRKRERNNITAENRVAIERRNLEAERESLDIERDTEMARLQKEREVETSRAEQEAELAATRFQRTREAEEARIEQERMTRQAEINKESAIDTAEIERIKAVEIARQEQAIAIATKSEEESAARAKAEDARAQAVRAEESVITARQVAEAERQKQVTVVRASERAESDAVGIRVQAEAEREAAENRAVATRTEAEANRDAQILNAAGTKARLEAEAEGSRAINEAANLLGASQIDLERTRILSAAMPSIIEASTKPMDNIDSIKIVDIGGLTGFNSGNSAADGSIVSGSSGNLADQVVNASLQYRSRRPLVDGLVNELFGAEGGLEALVTGAAPAALKAEKPAEYHDPIDRPMSADLETPARMDHFRDSIPQKMHMEIETETDPHLPVHHHD